MMGGDISERQSWRPTVGATFVLDARLHELEGYWLELHCCGGTILLPLKLIARQYGQSHRLGDILLRMRCKVCRGKPARAYLNETPHRTDCHGAPPGWSLQLIPAGHHDNASG